MESMLSSRPSKEELSQLGSKEISRLLKLRGLKSTGIKNAVVNRLYDNWIVKYVHQIETIF